PLVPAWVADNPYFQRVPPVVDWQLMLVIGIVIGGFIASRVTARMEAAERAKGDQASGAAEASPRGESCAAGPADPVDVSPQRRWRAFLGGFLVLFGARLADGCTSGHVITGMTPLATASVLFAAAVVAVGSRAAKWLRSKGWEEGGLRPRGVVTGLARGSSGCRSGGSRCRCILAARRLLHLKAVGLVRTAVAVGSLMGYR